MALSAANFASQAHCLVLFLRLLGLLPQQPGGPMPRTGSGGFSPRCESIRNVQWKPGQLQVIYMKTPSSPARPDVKLCL